MSRTVKLLRIDSSGLTSGSTTRQLTDELVATIEERYVAVDVVQRDLALGMPHVDHDWINANLTPEKDRSAEQKRKLLFSDELIAELQAADVLVFGVPIYNFSVPAALKAWVDMVARARVTFRYTEDGPLGLLENKKTYVVVASGGVGVGSDNDFATPYMRRALNFLGITDITVIAADQQKKRGDAIVRARQEIAAVVVAPIDNTEIGEAAGGEQ